MGGDRKGRVGSARRVARAVASWPGDSVALRRRVRKAKAAAALAGLVLVGTVVGRPAMAAEDACSANPIVCENSEIGNLPTEWDDMYGAGDWQIQGFATDMSVNAGQTISFKISTPATSYRVDIYRLGYYGGRGARKVKTIYPSAALPQHQPDCVTNAATEIYDCGVWAVSASWAVPADAVSGVYVAKPVRTDGTAGTSHIPFVVRDDARHSDIIFKTSDATWQAYNTYGGSSFYWGGPNGRAFKLSYNRPFATRGLESGRDYLFSNEYAMIRFLERNGYDVSYTTDVDADRRGNLLRNHKVFLSVGHDEYWSGAERANVEAARDAGVHLAFFSGNEVYWKTRWESSVDGSGTPYRTLVCYKETWANSKIDPSSEWTGTWRDPRFSPPSDGGRPENGLTGTMYMSNNTDLAIQVPAEQGRNRFWRNTTVATLAAGQIATLAPHTVGYESDEDLDNGFRPAGLIRLSTTTGPAPEYLRDFGSTTSPGTTTHHLTLYRAASGALVFGAGTIQWAWGLDSEHDGPQEPADPRMQQATVNLFADMGVQPATLMSGLAPATASTDLTAPSVAITAPAPATSVANGSEVTVSGTATDTGGRVAGVEVSTDGGETWHPATGTTSWSYRFHSNGVGTQVVKARAVDDSNNVQQVPASVTLKLTGPSTLFGTRVPANPAVSDTAGVELGVKVVPQSDGTITGIRFYKGTGNTGTHTGTLWTADGERLASGTFSNETATGWQTLVFSRPVQVEGDVTYVASYYAPSGHYAADPTYFSAGDHRAVPLVAPRSYGSGGNGVYRSGPGFPVTSYSDANYYVDVLFYDGDSALPVTLSVSPTPGQSHVDLVERPTVNFSKDIDPASIEFSLTDAANGPVAGQVSYDAAGRTARFTPTSPLATAQTYTARVFARDTGGRAMDEATTWTFTTTAYDQLSTLFPVDATPAVAASADSEALTLGVKIVPQVSGKIVGVRYYQGPGNEGEHTVRLYSETGTPLGEGRSTSSGTGWKSIYFDSPATVTAGVTYVATYFTATGRYAYDTGFFSSAHTSPDLALVAPAGSNGLYRYGSDGFPTNSYNSANYWVDPLFLTDEPPPGPPTQPVPPAGSVTLFENADTPDVLADPDNSSIELGVRFSSDVPGRVAGVRFYKGSQNSGAHTATLWSPDGQPMASGPFVAESGSGWQTMLFAEPVTITPGQTYTVSYHTDVGRYSVTVNGFAGGRNQGPLQVPTGGAVYRYGSTAFPSTSSNHNYWVDVVFLPEN
ncbi:Mo-co oxidoreductase dimerisation domain-containing protein [Micromonospora echinaurantiaca]|uniref:Mo-co oxidoreductase dimerisation domain-containing protein n=1 Tax=Micromonospora echinaurantiaca TaxID=47857 RepID=A0A1C5ILJ3_9ACTN|nr:Mo-co oxidoreductase dimerisation domain-containing protein [Micromonospora echinaurantiaca]